MLARYPGGWFLESSNPQRKHLMIPETVNFVSFFYGLGIGLLAGMSLAVLQNYLTSRK